MAVKTITIDLEAYSLLASRKREGQSFSAVIKENLGGKATAKDLLLVLSSLKVQDDTLDRIDEQVAQRRKDPAKAPRL
jgi:predicted CopG family antitoxin